MYSNIAFKKRGFCMEKNISVELGCEHIRVACVGINGKIYQILSRPTQIHEGKEGLAKQIISMIHALDDASECKHIGIGVPGPVDTKKGIIRLCNHFPELENYAIVERIQQEIPLPCTLVNDVNDAALGEAYFGAGKNHESIYYISLSTGIGGAYIYHHRIISGNNGYAGEIGNMIVDQNRDKINKLNVGAIENEASGHAITREGQYVFGEDMIHNAGDVFEQVRKKDPVAIQLCEDVSKDLAVMLSTIALVLDPQVFIFGGGCMKSDDVFFPLMEEHFRSLIYDDMQDIQLVKEELEDPELLGLAMCASDNEKKA